MSTRPHGRRIVAASICVAWAAVALGAGPAWADPAGRIQQVESTPGTVSFILAAQGLAEGQSIDPASVKVTIDGIEAKTSATGLNDAAAAPVQRTVMLALDSSGSMGEFGKLTTAQEAAKTYLASLPPDVEAGLVSFADTAQVKVAPTTDRAAVSRAVDSLVAEGSTALNDAVSLSVAQLGKDGSRNVVLLSDGKDEGSTTSAKKARQQLAKSGVVLDAVSLGKGSQQKELAAFAKAGNGTLVTATDADTLTAAFEAAARTVDTQLAVTSTVPDGVEAGTTELTAVAQVGDTQISDTAATVIRLAPKPSESAEAYGPSPVAEQSGGILDTAWFLPVVIGAIFLALAAITSLAVGAIDAKNRKEGRVSRRLEEVSVMGAPSAPASAPQSQTVLGDTAMTRRVVSFADRVAATRDTTVLAQKLESAAVTLRPGEWVVLHTLIAIAAGLVVTLLSGFNLVISLIAFALGLLLPWVYLGVRADRRRKQFYEALPDAMQLLAGGLSAGYSLPQALDNVARESPGPLGQEINRALLESRLGLPVEETLEAVAQRMQSMDFHWVVMAIRINRQVGGNLAEVLTNVSATLRERERLRRQVRTLSAEGRISAWIVGILPIFLFVFFFATRPDYVSLLVTQPIGWFILAIGAVLYLIGILWVRKLVRMEV